MLRTTAKSPHATVAATHETTASQLLLYGTREQVDRVAFV